jgi:hypothetical protein
VFVSDCEEAGADTSAAIPLKFKLLLIEDGTDDTEAKPLGTPADIDMGLTTELPDCD